MISIQSTSEGVCILVPVATAVSFGKAPADAGPHHLSLNQAGFAVCGSQAGSIVEIGENGRGINIHSASRQNPAEISWSLKNLVTGQTVRCSVM